MVENLKYKNYQQFKQVFDATVHNAVESFVIIGYLLNEAAVTDILLESGYANVNEFAQNEYKLEPTQVSRFINIHRRFGVEGEPRLKDRYVNHGVAKLGIMLTLPDYINEEISEGYSKSEIKALKDEIAQEEKITDIEVLMEAKDEVQQSLLEMLQKEVYQLIHDYPNEYEHMYKAHAVEDLKEVLIPNAECVYMIRIAGIGRLSMFMKTENIVVANVRSGEKEVYEWKQLFDAVQEHVAMGRTAKESWENVFKEDWPLAQKTELKTGKDDAQKLKPKKGLKVKVPAPKSVNLPKPESKEEPVKEAEEQLRGQDNIMNHPEWMPDDMKEGRPEVITGEVVTCDDIAGDEVMEERPEGQHNDNVQQDSEGMKVEYVAPVQDIGTEHAVEGLKRVLRASVETLGVMVEKEDWPMVISKAADIVHRAKKVQELEEKN